MDTIELNTDAFAEDNSDVNSQERAYRFIKAAIKDYQLKPGQRIAAGAIAENLAISRTPVREALGRLEQERLVKRESGWGYAVVSLSLSDVMNIFRVREVLEVEAAKEAVANLSDPVLKMMDETLKRAGKLLKEGDVASFLQLARQFHNTISNLTGNSILQDMLSTISDRIQIIGAMLIDHYASRADEILDENQRILKALRSGDEEKIESAVRGHVRRAGECVKASLSQGF